MKDFEDSDFKYVYFSFQKDKNLNNIKSFECPEIKWDVWNYD